MRYNITYTLKFKTGEVTHPMPVPVNGKKAAAEVAANIVKGQEARGHEVADLPAASLGECGSLGLSRVPGYSAVLLTAQVG